MKMKEVMEHFPDCLAVIKTFYGPKSGTVYPEGYIDYTIEVLSRVDGQIKAVYNSYDFETETPFKTLYGEYEFEDQPLGYWDNDPRYGVGDGYIKLSREAAKIYWWVRRRVDPGYGPELDLLPCEEKELMAPIRG